MAEEVVVREALSPEMIEAGASLTRMLDEAGLRPTAALWFFVPEANHWRLIFAIPSLPQTGPKDAYSKIVDALGKLSAGKPAPPFRELVVVDPSDPLIRLLSSAIRTGDGVAQIRFSQNAINGQFIDDALIYRLR